MSIWRAGETPKSFPNNWCAGQSLTQAPTGMQNLFASEDHIVKQPPYLQAACILSTWLFYDAIWTGKFITLSSAITTLNKI
jgi:hypothetical protein